MPSISLPWHIWNWEQLDSGLAEETTEYRTEGGSIPSNGVYQGNFVWYEDSDGKIDRFPDLREFIFKSTFVSIDPMIPNQPPLHHYMDLSPLLPFGMMLIISTIIFMLIIFRRWPGLVAGIVAGCLTSISIYLLLLTLKEQKLVYE